MQLIEIISGVFTASALFAQSSVPSMFDPNFSNAPKMPNNLEISTLDQAGIDLYLKCQNAVAVAFKTTGNSARAQCEVIQNVAGCSDVLTCAKTPKPFVNPSPKIKPVPSPGPSPSPNRGGGSTTPGGGDTKTQTNGGGGGGGSDGGTTTPASTTDANEQADLDKCQSAASSADSACTDSSDDDNGYLKNVSDGLTAACKDLQAAGSSSAKKAAEKSKACSDAYMACTQTCSTLADTHSESDNWSTFNSASRKCLALESKAKAMRDSSSSSNSAAKAGINCISDSSESPQSASSGSNARSSSAPSTAAGGLASGLDAQNSAAAAATGGAGDASQAKAKGSFDVGDTSNAGAPNPFGSDPYPSSPATAPKVTPISNNSGGSIPGGGGGHAANANAGGGGVMGAVKSTIADIQRGLFGGGGGATTDPKPAAEEISIFDENGNPRLSPEADARRRAARKTETEDLKRYLPGGDLWRKQRGPASIEEIQGPGVDIWQRIHDRLIVKCKLGELYDCQLP